MPQRLRDLFLKDPQGIAKNMIEIALQVRIPSSVKSLEGLDQHMRRELWPTHTTAWREHLVQTTSYPGLPHQSVATVRQLAPRDAVAPSYYITIPVTIAIEFRVEGMYLQNYIEAGYSLEQAANEVLNHRTSHPEVFRKFLRAYDQATRYYARENVMPAWDEERVTGYEDREDD